MTSAHPEKMAFSTPKISTGMGVIANTERGAMYAARKGAGALSHMAPPIAVGALAVLSIFDQRLEKKNITDHYRSEIAARLGKHPNKVTISDMEKVAQENPVIGAAVKRTSTRRNLNIGLAVAGVAAAVALISPVGWVVGLTSLTGIAAWLATAGLTVAIGYFGIEKPLAKFGEKRLGLDEPELHAVHKNPALQADLSVPSQISLLSHMQAHGRRISQQQVASVFVTANPAIAAEIKQNYGVPFHELPESVKDQVVMELSKQHGIAELTDAINSRAMRAQELAFAAHGQSSGVVGAEVRQRNIADLQQKLDEQAVAQFYAPDPTETQQSVYRQRLAAERQRSAQQTTAMGAA